MVVVEEKKAWVGWQPDGDATVPRRADLQLRREAEQVSEGGCIAGSGQEGSALELCYATPTSAGWVQPVWCSLSTFHSNKNGQSVGVPGVGWGGGRRSERGWGGEGGRWRDGFFFFFSRFGEFVNPVIPSLRDKMLLVQKCWDFIIVAVNFC